MTDPLPATMVARLREIGAALVSWAHAHPGATLAEQEAAVLAEVRSHMAALLAEVLRITTPELTDAVGPLPRCLGCAMRTPVHSWRARTVQTVCGAVTLMRAWHRCRRCQHGFSPADTSLALDDHARLSAGLHDWLVDLGATTSFREAARLLSTLTGQTVAAETLRRHTEQEGAAHEAAQQQAIRTVAATQDAAAPLDPAPGQLTVETDGVMVRYQDGWHEVKVGVVAGHQDGTMHAPSYVAAREGPDQFGPRLLAEAARRGALTVQGWTGPMTGRGLAVLRPVAVVGDGAAWIWHLAADHFGDRIEIVDYYHATEHLWQLARALFGADTLHTVAWATAQAHILWEQGVTPVLGTLATIQPTTTEAREALRRERGYFTTHVARMDYPAFRDRGLPIGSGAVESSARHLVQQRLKRAGCRWSPAGAQSLLTLRAQRASHRSIAA